MYQDDIARVLYTIQDYVSRRPTSKTLPAKAKVVICGGGAQGAAIAYKLGRTIISLILT